MKASDIPDETFLAIVERHNVEQDRWCLMWDLTEALPEFPWKVIKAKAGKLIKRKLLQGCDCGCRGDFEIPEWADTRVRRPQSPYTPKYYSAE